MGSTRAQPRVNQGPTWVQHGVNPGSTCGLPGVNMGCTSGQPAPPYLGPALREARKAPPPTAAYLCVAISDHQQ